MAHDDDTDDLPDFASLHLSPPTARPAVLAPEMDREEAKILEAARVAPFRAKALGLVID